MSAGISSDAVVFVEGNGNIVAKEMLYPEFEAILDHVVGIEEFKSVNTTAVFLRINSQLHITAAVFFTLEFDASGYVDKSWNIPLQHLVDTAGPGPDLGSGPIKLACRSQCSVSWHQRALWDPNFDEGDSNTLTILAKSIRRNRLGLAVVDTDNEPPVLGAKEPPGKERFEAKAELEAKIKKKYQQELKTRSAALIEEHKLRLAALKSETQDHIEAIQQQHLNERLILAETLESTKQLFSEEKHRNLQLKKTLATQAQDMSEARERVQEELEQAKEVEQEQLLLLEERFELEYKAKLDEAKTELKEMLDMREVELFYRDEQVKRLNQEVAQLRQEKQNLIDGSGDRVLQRLVESGVTFVAYQPGVDHLTIPLREMSDYLESPINYVAEKSSVDKDLYQRWIAHYELPVCNHVVTGNELCAKPIPKVERPGRFIIGESDRCLEHNRASNALSELIKVREPS